MTVSDNSRSATVASTPRNEIEDQYHSLKRDRITEPIGDLLEDGLERLFK